MDASLDELPINMDCSWVWVSLLLLLQDILAETMLFHSAYSNSYVNLAIFKVGRSMCVCLTQTTLFPHCCGPGCIACCMERLSGGWRMGHPLPCPGCMYDLQMQTKPYIICIPFQHLSRQMRHLFSVAAHGHLHV
jgi:hypothetical protein